MSNEFNKTPKGSDMQDVFFPFSQGITYTGRIDDGPTPFSFTETGPPTETDLLPDEEFDSIARSSMFKNAYEYEIAVIGGGPAGYSAALRAAKLGAKTVLFEREMLGGFAIGGGSILNLRNILLNKNNIVTHLTAVMARMLRSYRVRVEVGEAILESEHEIVCRGKSYSVAKVILCGGSGAVRPNVPGVMHPGVWTISDAMKATEAPSRIVVYGGGRVGCEIATVFTAAGSSVMLVEPEPRLLKDMDAQLAEAVKETLARAGVKIYTGVSVREVTDRGGQPYVITGRGGVLCDKFLIALDRKPDISSLGNLKSGFTFSGDYIAVNEYLETCLTGIYAAGDCTGLALQAHAASRIGEIAAENAMGRKKAVDLRAIPVMAYTTPAVASVGMSEEEAKYKYGDEVVTGFSLLSGNVRAILSGRTEGFVKVLAGKKHGEIYGVHIYGEEAGELIAEPAALMRMEVTIHEVCGDIIHAHPSYAEAFVSACEDALNKGVGE